MRSLVSLLLWIFPSHVFIFGPFVYSLVSRFGRGCLFALLLSASLLPMMAMSQVPRQIHYQATLVEGDTPVDGTADLSFAFYADSTGGEPLADWSETRSGVELTDGRLNVLLGRQTPLPDELFEQSSLYLQVTVDEEALPRLPVASSAFALRAATAESVGAGSITSEALASESVGSSALVGGAVTTSALADEAVTERTLAEGAVTLSALAEGAVTTEVLAERAITSDKLGESAVVGDVLADGAVTSSKLSNGAVTEGKIDGNQVVKTLNDLTDEVSLVGGDDISITTDEQEGTITIDASSGFFSSRRWKTDIRPLEESLSLVEQLQGVRFRWEESGESDIGLIAEEVGTVVPEVVTYADNGVDAEKVDYARLVALLIEAVKAQQAKIESDRATLEALERRIEALEQQSTSSNP